MSAGNSATHRRRNAPGGLRDAARAAIVRSCSVRACVLCAMALPAAVSAADARAWDNGFPTSPLLGDSAQETSTEDADERPALTIGAARPFQIASLPPSAHDEASGADQPAMPESSSIGATDAEEGPPRADENAEAPAIEGSPLLAADEVAEKTSVDARRLPDADGFRTLGEEISLIEGGDGDRGRVAGITLPWLDRLDPRAAEFLRVSGALVVVLGLLFVTRMLLRRAGGPLVGAGRPSGVLEILARYPVGRKQSLILIKLARRIVLVHQSGDQMRTLAEVSDGNEVSGLLARMEAGSRSRESARFRDALQAFESEHEEGAQTRLRSSMHGSSDIEVVDLTRSQLARFGNVFGRRRLR